MLYVGLDYHCKRSSYCVMDENGNILMNREVKGSWIEVINDLTNLKKERREQMEVCFEASSGAGHLTDRLRAIARRVVVAHPGKLRLIFKSKRKNDRVDAQKLALLLKLGHVPTAYMPDRNVRAWRKTIEYRTRLVAKRVRVKNEIRGLLRSVGLEPPKKLWTKAGVAWLEGLEFDHHLESLRIETLIEELAYHTAKIKRVEKALRIEANQRPAVHLLMTIPGIGIRTAEAIAAYIDDPDRFDRVQNIGAYFGLVPRLDSSAGRHRLGHITKEGPPTVRKLLTEAAWLAIRKSPEIRAYHERIKKDDPDRNKIAIIATAHYLSRVSLAMLKTGECWNPNR